MAMAVTPDMTWTIPGLPDRVDYAGSFSFAQILPKLESFLGILDAFSFVVTDTTAEGESVVVQATSHGELHGTVYENIYLMQYKLREGRIASIKEFMDQSSVADFVARLGAAG